MNRRDPHTGEWLEVKNFQDVDMDILPTATCMCGNPITYLPRIHGWNGGWLHDSVANFDDPCYATPVH